MNYAYVKPVTWRLLLLLLALLASLWVLGAQQGLAEAPTQQTRTNEVPWQATQIPESQTRAVQLVLKSFGYTIEVDGIYGPQTTAIVKKWQKANGLTIDGIAGPVTLDSLGLSPAVRGAQVAIPAPPQSVPDMIRAIWPDELEDKALRIAYRESRYNPGVTSSTGCCHGVFQLHEIHLRWMSNFGVTSVSQLFDAETNIRMAYELYKRDGWAPWAL